MNKSFYLIEPKQNDARQTYTHISVPTNLQHELQGLAAENQNVINRYGRKREKKNIMKHTYAGVFFTI